MSNLSKRLQVISYFVEKEDKVVDIGCDHGYLSIYLDENKLCKSIIATDVNASALKNAQENIKKKHLFIKTILSDGLEKVPLNECDTLIICGMGTNTILHILKEDKLQDIKKIILQSNNDHFLLRKSLNNLGYYLDEEKVIFDKGKWYVTMLFIKSAKKNKERELLYGYLNNPEYNDFLLNQYKKITKSIPITSISAKIKAYRRYKNFKKSIQ